MKVINTFIQQGCIKLIKSDNKTLNRKILNFQGTHLAWALRLGYSICFSLILWFFAGAAPAFVSKRGQSTSSDPGSSVPAGWKWMQHFLPPSERKNHHWRRSPTTGTCEHMHAFFKLIHVSISNVECLSYFVGCCISVWSADWADGVKPSSESWATSLLWPHQSRQRAWQVCVTPKVCICCNVMLNTWDLYFNDAFCFVSVLRGCRHCSWSSQLYHSSDSNWKVESRWTPSWEISYRKRSREPNREKVQYRQRVQKPIRCHALISQNTKRTLSLFKPAMMQG